MLTILGVAGGVLADHEKSPRNSLQHLLLAVTCILLDGFILLTVDEYDILAGISPGLMCPFKLWHTNKWSG